MGVNDVIFYTLAVTSAFILWVLLVKSQRNAWNQSEESRLSESRSELGIRSNFDGLHMYEGDPELVTRLEMKLRDLDHEQ